MNFKGDSGGPLTWKGMIIGIASFAMMLGLEECPHDNCPSVFTKISPYEEWIESVINKPNTKNVGEK